MAVTLERYLAVAKPMIVRNLNRRVKTSLSLSVLAFAILYNLPKWWELEDHLVTISNVTIYLPVRTPLKKHQLYFLLYVNISYLVVLIIFPVCFMTTLNCMTYLEVIQKFPHSWHLLVADYMHLFSD